MYLYLLIHQFLQQVPLTQRFSLELHSLFVFLKMFGLHDILFNFLFLNDVGLLYIFFLLILYIDTHYKSDIYYIKKVKIDYVIGMFVTFLLLKLQTTLLVELICPHFCKSTSQPKAAISFIS